MILSRRSLTRATALTLAALTFAACGDSTRPLEVSPEQLEALGEVIAAEVQSGALQLTAADAMGNVDAPTFSVLSGGSRTLAGLALNQQRAAGPSFQVVDPECGVPSQNPPTDTDSDGVPDNFTVTFMLPGCHFTGPDGSFDLTGLIRVSDPSPGTAAAAFNMALENFRFTFDTPDIDGFVRRDGLTSVAASASGLSQSLSLLESAQITGYPQIGVDVDWTATFAAAQGTSITPGEPLPSGTYIVNGALEFRQANQVGAFTVTTVNPLVYDAGCAADLATGLALSPFSSGKVRVGVRNDAARGFAEITYVDCGQAVVVYTAA